MLYHLRKRLIPLVTIALLLALTLPLASLPKRANAAPSGTINFAFWNYGPDARPGWEALIAEFNIHSSA